MNSSNKMCTRIPYTDGECPMLLECYEDDLSPVQKSAYEHAMKEYNDYLAKYEEEVSYKNAEIVEQRERFTVYRLPQKEITKQSKVGSIRIKPPTQLLESPMKNDAPTQIKTTVANTLVTTPKLSNIVKPISPKTVIRLSSVTITPISNQSTVKPVSNQPAVTNADNAVKPALSLLPKLASFKKAEYSKTDNKPTSNNGVRTAIVKPSVQMKNQPTKPAVTIDLTDDGRSKRPSQKRNPPNNNTSQMFPSLVIIARPCMKHKDITSAVLAQERANLDVHVKSACSVLPNVFVEWLIQKGLILCEQTCTTHRDIRNQPVQLKLARIYEKDKLPNSGGYVWIGDCCPNKYLASVFHRSLLQDVVEVHECTPFVAVKLIYHWVCQSSINNIINWTNVDKHIVKAFFTNLRSVCTAALWEKSGLFGGPKKKIQVAVIGLGTINLNNKLTNIKSEILGVLDPETKFIRLHALEKKYSSKDDKSRAKEILSYLPRLVDRQSTIIIDRSVNSAILQALGFNSILQLGSEMKLELTEYLRTVLPRMFQSTLHSLTDSLLQQFLDELCWRERFGHTSERAFNNILDHISEQTAIKTGVGLLPMLEKIYSNPFKNWKYSDWNVNDSNSVNTIEEVQFAYNGDSLVGEQQLLTIDENALVPSIDMLPPSITQIDNDIPMQLDDSFKSTCPSTSKSTGLKGKKRSQKSSNDDDRIIKKSSTSLSMNYDGLISLECFYYGTLNSYKKAQWKVYTVNLGISCCGNMYNCNLDLMEHAVQHVLEERQGYASTDFICKYCYENFKSDIQLNLHIQNEHKKNSRSKLSCLICMKTYASRWSLIKHMKDTHEELELPYYCKVCTYRTSQHVEMIDHFYEKHKGGEHVLCPFCLRTILLASNEQKLSSNANFFINHIKRHVRVKKDKQCDKCQLRFSWSTDYREHCTKDHVSFADITVTGVERRACTLDDTMMPVPFINNKNELLKKGRVYTCINTNLKMPSVSLARHECKECSRVLLNDKDNHFEQYFSCLLCRYATYCLRAMKCHVADAHVRKTETKPRKPIEKLEKSMFCPCGFSSDCGMDVAQHLEKCDSSRIAYESAESAVTSSLTVQSTVDMNDAEQEITTRYLTSITDPYESSGNDSSPDILRSLGLRRCKPPSESKSLFNEGEQESAKTNNQMEGEMNSEEEKESEKGGCDVEEIEKNKTVTRVDEEEDVLMNDENADTSHEIELRNRHDN